MLSLVRLFFFTTCTFTNGKLAIFSDYLKQIDQLKEENKQLSELNLTSKGESAILRADLQQMRVLLEKRDCESSQKLLAMKKQTEEAEARLKKQLEAFKTEMKFKV